MHKPPVKYLVIIESDGAMVAKLYDAQFRHENDIDAGSEEVAVMTRGLKAEKTGNDATWSKVLAGHGETERRAAEVYTLDL
ncbi:hypothetical protein LRS03_07520 [Rhizobacter sp. J219]|jgi:hypothetical protein|uniref:hypothetical protein n=1 Tax=Rhizobacter sp. J219 TaxID=2898430 RepID=UPI00215126E8|nr:hypothetical protein [Rhizobacter sp. J219]MCR5882710.1 hypothetical protein [Rhizobacter sp. J219]